MQADTKKQTLLSPDFGNQANNTNALRNAYAHQIQYSIDLGDPEPIIARQETRDSTFSEYIKIFMVLAVIGFILYIIYQFVGVEAFLGLVDSLRTLVKSDSTFSYLLIVILHFPFAWIPFMPGISTFDVLLAYLMQSFWLPFILSFLGWYLGSISLFLLVKMFFRNAIVERIRKNILFRIAYIEIKKSPWKMGFLFNMLFVPPSVKNYIMAVSSLTIDQYALILIPVHAIFSMKFAIVGYSMNGLDDILKGQSFSEKTASQKAETIFTYILAFLSMLLMGYFAYFMKQKYDEVMRDYRMEAESARSHMQELDSVNHGAVVRDSYRRRDVQMPDGVAPGAQNYANKALP